MNKHIGVIEDLESAIKIWMPDPEKTQICQSLHVAIYTMRKYQTMQAVLEKVWDVPACMLDKAECLDKIMETYKTVR